MNGAGGRPGIRRSRAEAGTYCRPPGRIMVTAVAVMAATTACLLAAACTGKPGRPAASPTAPGPPGPSQPGPAPGHGPAWLLTRGALSQLVRDPAARARVDGARIYEILRPGQRPLAGVAADPVVTFSSAAGLTGAVRRGDVPAGSYGVLYDPEAWPYTPPDEQRDPVAAAARAAQGAHARGLRLLVSPAVNLATVLAPGSRKPRWQRFLNLRLAARMAAVADIVDIQAQSLERDTASYTAFVRAAAAQARSAKPGVTVLAGLSTNPPGEPVTSQHLADVIQATRALVDGYWLNIPAPGPRCPTCNPSRPEIGRQVLRQAG